MRCLTVVVSFFLSGCGASEVGTAVADAVPGDALVEVGDAASDGCVTSGEGRCCNGARACATVKCSELAPGACSQAVFVCSSCIEGHWVSDGYDDLCFFACRSDAGVDARFMDASVD